MEITTIKLEKKTKNRLDSLRTHKRDSYEDIVQRILHILNICRANPLKSRVHLAAITRKNRKIKLKIVKEKPKIVKEKEKTDIN